MPKQIDTSLAAIVAKNVHDTHHLRLKIAPEMFHAYCRKMSPDMARAVTIEILRISQAGFDFALKKDPLEPLRTAQRNQTILDLRSSGYSFASIAKQVNLSRVQIWRIIEGFQTQIDTIKMLSGQRIHKTRLTHDQLSSIERMKKSAGKIRPIQTPSTNVYFLSGSKNASAPNSVIAAPTKSCRMTFSATSGTA